MKKNTLTTIKYVLLIYFAISTFVGCNRQTSTLQMDGSSQAGKIPAGEPIFSSQLVEKQTHDFGIVLLHGCQGSPDDFNAFEEEIRDTFGKKALIINPKCRAQIYNIPLGNIKVHESVICDIENQTKKVFEEIQSELDSYKAINLPLCIIGYSQGGLVACMLGDKYQAMLNICGIVTWNAPLDGVPALDRTNIDIEKFIAHIPHLFLDSY